MSSAADFYIGWGNRMEWIGTLPANAMPQMLPVELIRAKTQDSYIQVLRELILDEGGFSSLRDQWPWVYESSAYTPYIYTFHLGAVWVSRLGCSWFMTSQCPREPHLWPTAQVVALPNMWAQQVERKRLRDENTIDLSEALGAKGLL